MLLVYSRPTQEAVSRANAERDRTLVGIKKMEAKVKYSARSLYTARVFPRT